MWALVMHEPFLQLVVDRRKPWEFRCWGPSPGRVSPPFELLMVSAARFPSNKLIEERKPLLRGAAFTNDAYDQMFRWRGHARCVVTVQSMEWARRERHGNVPGFAFRHANGRRMKAWEIENVRPIPPVPARGARGLFQAPWQVCPFCRGEGRHGFAESTGGGCDNCGGRGILSTE